MKDYLALLRKHHIARGIVLVLTSRILKAAIAFATGVIVSRELGAAAFGLYSFFMVVLIIGMELAVSEGLNFGLVHFVSTTVEHDRNLANGYVRTALKAKLIGVVGLVCLTVVTGFLFLPLFPAQQYLLVPLLFGAAGAGFASLWRGTLANLQAQRRFQEFSILSVVPNMVNIVLILDFILFGFLTLKITLSIIVIGFLLGLIYGMSFLPEGIVRLREPEHAMRDLIGFSKWTILYSILTVFLHRLDVLLLSIVASPVTVGVYAVAAMLANIIYIFYEAGIAVLLPNASRIKTKEDFRHFLPKSLMVTTVLSLAGVFVFIFADLIIDLVFTSEYASTAPILRILSLGLVFTVLFDPLSIIVLAKGKPQKAVGVTGLSLAAFILAAVVLYPSLGATGIAWATVISRVISGLAFLILARREVT